MLGSWKLFAKPAMLQGFAFLASNAKMVMALLAAEASHFCHVMMAQVLAGRVVAALSRSWHGSKARFRYRCNYHDVLNLTLGSVRRSREQRLRGRHMTGYYANWRAVQSDGAFIPCAWRENEVHDNPNLCLVLSSGEIVDLIPGSASVSRRPACH